MRHKRDASSLLVERSDFMQHVLFFVCYMTCVCVTLYSPFDTVDCPAALLVKMTCNQDE